ncbi:unnamed protein product [Closterium sp. Naga37s-1]|nr:unnamed protein product [Closterium sp. Naga37s-1]
MSPRFLSARRRWRTAEAAAAAARCIPAEPLFPPTVTTTVTTVAIGVVTTIVVTTVAAAARAAEGPAPLSRVTVTWAALTVPAVAAPAVAGVATGQDYSAQVLPAVVAAAAPLVVGAIVTAQMTLTRPRQQRCIGSPFPGSSAHSCGGGAGGGSSGGIGGGSGGGSGGSGGSSGPVVSVAYALNVLGVRGPRRILCTLHQVPAGAAVTGGGGSGAAGAGRGAGGKAGRGTGEEAGGGRGEGRSLARGASGGSGRGWGDASAVAEAAGEAAAEGARRAAAAAADVAGTAAAALGLDPVIGTSDIGTLRSPRPATLPPVTTSDRSSVSTPPVTVPPSTPPPATPSPATAAVLAAGAAAAAATSPLLSSLFHSNRYSHTRYSNHSCDLPEEQKSDEQAPGQSQPPTCTSSFTPSPLPRPSWPSSPASSPAAAHPAGATSAPPHFPAPSALHSPASPPDVLIAPTGSSASPSPSASASAAPPCPASAFPPCLELPSSALSSASPAARSCAYRLKSGEEMGAGESMGSSGKEESDEQQSMREEGVEEGGQWEKKSQEESSPEDGSLEEGNQQEECGDWPTDGACEQQESSGEGRSEQEGNQAATPPFAASSAPSLAALPAAPSASAAPSPAAAPPAFNAEADAEGDTEGDLASVKNFQLIEGGGPGNDSDKPVLLQFGKIGKDTFTMDYRYPLTAFQIGKDTFTMDYRYPLTAFQITTGAGGGLGEGGSAGGAEAPEGAAASAAAGGKVGGRTGGGVGGGAGGSAGGGKSAGGRKRRGGVAVGLADLEQGRGWEWEEWEEVGGGVGGAAAGTTEAEAKALAFRDRLVEYNRTSAQRTVVIDDQSDYFKSNGADGDGDAWLTNEEREILRRREEEREREEEERRRRVVVTLDLIGRRVLVADSPGADVARGGADVAGSEGAKPGQEGSEKQTKGASGGASGRRGGGRTGVGSIFLMGGQNDKGQGDMEQGERDQIPTMKQEVVSGIKVLIKGEGGGGGGSAAGGLGRTRLMPSPNLPIAAPVFVKPSSANSSSNGASGTGGAAVAGGAAAGGASSNEATGQGKKGGKGKKGQQEQQHVKEQESDRRRGAYKEGMARLQHDSPLMEAMREIEEEVGGRSGGGGNRRIDKERGSRGGEVGNQGVGYRGVIGGGTAGGGLDSRENRDRDGPCGIPADLAGLADLADDEADVDGRFDICVQTDQRGGLLRGVGGAGGVRGSEAGIDGGRGGVLQDGMLEIVKECRRLGLGPGGFYRPKFLNGGQMKLHMMCLGQQHWEPNLRTYQPRRTYVDDAKPPALPLSISSLAVQAVSAAQTAVRAASGSSNKSILPDMTPSVCIANFYSPRRGALGMHQDKDEPPASIRRGAPVVSFSVGDSADFLFGWQRDPEKAAKVVLESGDVVVFGGPSRLMFHGVPCVHGGTAPDWLAQETGLRPGRLNLTVREL